MTEPNLDPWFDGSDYDHLRDKKRLGKQFETIKDLMSDGKWRTLKEIESSTGYPAPSISAQLRHMRKPRFGGYIVQKEHLGNGLYRYKVSSHAHAEA